MEYLQELSFCILCEHRCGVDRLAGEKGVCRVTLPAVASAQLHPAPPESYTVFMGGCNFKCLNCQNWTISQYPDNGYKMWGYITPGELAARCVTMLDTPQGKAMGADRIFFSGGEATIHLPYIEAVVACARAIAPATKVNFDTNGYMTEESLRRVLRFTTSVTFDIKAFRDEVHRAITGAPVAPILRNAEILGREAKDKLWEYRVLVIPGINEEDVPLILEFVADIGPSLPVALLAFRPNFVLEKHSGATAALMQRCVEAGMRMGLKNVHAHGHTGIWGHPLRVRGELEGKYESKEAMVTASYALRAGCKTHPRHCSACPTNQSCPLKAYKPSRIT